ncbi:MAG: phage major capsid protein [Actinomycetota bacterium]
MFTELLSRIRTEYESGSAYQAVQMCSEALEERRRMSAAVRSTIANRSNERPDGSRDVAPLASEQRALDQLDNEILELRRLERMAEEVARQEAAGDRAETAQRRRNAEAADLSDTRGQERPADGRTPEHARADFGRPLPAGTSFRSLPGVTDAPAGSFGRYLRAMAMEDHATVAELRQIGTGTAGTGGLFPTGVLPEIFDAARAFSRVVEAGAAVIPLREGQVKAAAFVDDPVVAWRAEHGAIGESEPTLSSLTFDPKSLAVIARVSWEAMQDSGIAVDDLLTTAFAAAFAAEWDRAALLGDGTNDQPTGLDATVGVPETATVGEIDYDKLITAVSTVRGRNFRPGRLIGAVRDAAALGSLREGAGTGQYLRPPAYLEDNLPMLDTQKIPVDGGVGTDESKAYVGEWRYLVLGVRLELDVMVLREHFADTGEVGFLGHFRGDIQVMRPTAFQILDGIVPA